MKDYMNKAFVGFMAGLISAFILVIVFTVFSQHTISLTDQFKYELYRLMIWGGVWAILFAFPLSKNIWIKITIVGLAVIFFNCLVLINAIILPLFGKGFFAIGATPQVFFMNIIFNYLWAILTGVIYIRVARD